MEHPHTQGVVHPGSTLRHLWPQRNLGHRSEPVGRSFSHTLSKSLHYRQPLTAYLSVLPLLAGQDVMRACCWTTTSCNPTAIDLCTFACAQRRTRGLKAWGHVKSIPSGASNTRVGAANTLRRSAFRLGLRPESLCRSPHFSALRALAS